MFETSINKPLSIAVVDSEPRRYSIASLHLCGAQGLASMISGTVCVEDLSSTAEPSGLPTLSSLECTTGSLSPVPTPRSALGQDRGRSPA